MLKLSQLDRALSYQNRFGNPSDTEKRLDNLSGKPNLPGTRAARIHAAQHPIQETVSKIPQKK